MTAAARDTTPGPPANADAHGTENPTGPAHAIAPPELIAAVASLSTVLDLTPTADPDDLLAQLPAIAAAIGACGDALAVLREARLTVALDLYRDTSVPVQEIAELFGTTPSYLTRMARMRGLTLRRAPVRTLAPVEQRTPGSTR